MLKDLTVLTPPLLVCIAFLIAVVAFLRHEMRPRRGREDQVSDDISTDDSIPDQEPSARSAPSERSDGN
jgi:hypothetical protein